MERVHPDDPSRCEGHAGREQCHYRAEPGDTKCLACGGKDLVAAESKRQYLLTNIESRRRLAQFAESEQIKSLRDEIAMARVLTEKRFNLIKNDADLLSACGPLNTLFLTIERLVKTCHTTEQSLGVLLSRATILNLAQQMCQIVIDELQDVPGFEEIVGRVSDRLVGVVMKARNDDPKRLEVAEQPIDVEYSKSETQT